MLWRLGVAEVVVWARRRDLNFLIVRAVMSLFCGLDPSVSTGEHSASSGRGDGEEEGELLVGDDISRSSISLSNVETAVEAHSVILEPTMLGLGDTEGEAK